jgi:chitinase
MRVRSTVLGAIAGLVLLGATLAGCGPESTTGAGEPTPAMREVGYFPQWVVYTQNFFVKNLVTSGAAARLTNVDYAFAKVAKEGNAIVCQSGDPVADYTKVFTADQTVDGVPDAAGAKLNGNFAELRKLKARYPKLKVILSIGGWDWSDIFSDAALTAGSRQAFVSSCVDRFIRGNLPVSAGSGGPGSAAGIFDGVDIDWEWPGSEGNPGNTIRNADKANYAALVKEFRRQLDAYGQQTGKHYELSAFIPAEPTKITAGFDTSAVFASLDYGNVQGYDFHGGWEATTNQQSALRIPDGAPTDNPDFSLDGAIQAWLDAGVAPAKLVLGVPSYGEGWSGVKGGGDGLFQQASRPAAGSVEQGSEYFRNLESLPNKGFKLYRDTDADFAWLFDGSTFWTIDDPTVIAAKMAYVRKNKLGGAMMWDLSGDDAKATLQTAIDTGLHATS